MRFSIFVFVSLLSACGPDLSGWKGTWAGSAELNDGRSPTTVTGTLTVGDDGFFQLTSDATGTPARTFSCGLTATSATAVAATFKVPASCALTVTPADDCAWQVNVTDASATRLGDSLRGDVKGRLDKACASSNSSVSDFLMSFNATRK